MIKFLVIFCIAALALTSARTISNSKVHKRQAGYSNFNPCKDPAGPMYHAHPADTTKYIQCDNGNALERKCAPSTYWHPIQLTCVGAKELQKYKATMYKQQAVEQSSSGKASGPASSGPASMYGPPYPKQQPPQQYVPFSGNSPISIFFPPSVDLSALLAALYPKGAGLVTYPVGPGVGPVTGSGGARINPTNLMPTYHGGAVGAVPYPQQQITGPGTTSIGQVSAPAFSVSTLPGQIPQQPFVTSPGKPIYLPPTTLPGQAAWKQGGPVGSGGPSTIYSPDDVESILSALGSYPNVNVPSAYLSGAAMQQTF